MSRRRQNKGKEESSDSSSSEDSSESSGSESSQNSKSHKSLGSRTAKSSHVPSQKDDSRRRDDRRRSRSPFHSDKKQTSDRHGTSSRSDKSKYDDRNKRKDDEKERSKRVESDKRSAQVERKIRNDEYNKKKDTGVETIKAIKHLAKPGGDQKHTHSSSDDSDREETIRVIKSSSKTFDVKKKTVIESKSESDSDSSTGDDDKRHVYKAGEDITAVKEKKGDTPEKNRKKRGGESIKHEDTDEDIAGNAEKEEGELSDEEEERTQEKPLIAISDDISDISSEEGPTTNVSQRQRDVIKSIKLPPPQMPPSPHTPPSPNTHSEEESRDRQPLETLKKSKPVSSIVVEKGPKGDPKTAVSEKQEKVESVDLEAMDMYNSKQRPILESESEEEEADKTRVQMGSSVTVVKTGDDKKSALSQSGGKERSSRSVDRSGKDQERVGDGKERHGYSDRSDRRRDHERKDRHDDRRNRADDYRREDRRTTNDRDKREDRRPRNEEDRRNRSEDDRRSRNDDSRKEDRRTRDEDKEITKSAVAGTEEASGGQGDTGKKKPDLDITTRTGGAYIPPAKLRMMQEQITDKTSAAYQRMSWEALKKSINGLINKVNVSNLINIIKEIFQENIVRGRGLLARSVIQAQAASPTFTHVYAALVAIINTKFPQNGELILRRLILMFRRGYRRNDKSMCLSTTRFIAHLVNQQVAHEVLALEVLTLLLETPTDDSVEVAIGFLKECGQKLTEVSPRGINSIFERLRNVLHEGQLDVRVQYMVEVMFAIRKDGFKDHAAVLPELDLVEEEEQFTHLLQLEDAVTGDEMLNIFHEDPLFAENEEKYKALKKEILDEGSSDEESDQSSESGSSDSEEDEEAEEKANAEKQTIIDQTETNLIALRRTIYLTVQSSLDHNECAHKMLKMDLKPGQEVELCNMILDCCAQLRTYEKFFGLLAQRFCQIDKKYIEPFQQIFTDQYETIHRLETNKLRNVAKFFAHLLYTDAISWGVLSVVKLTEEDTSSASRIFLKILFQELSEYMGLFKLNERLKDPTLSPFFAGVMPRDNPKNTRFSINFFTTIGLGGLTDDLREHLKVATKLIQQQKTEAEKSSSSESSQSSDSSESESSSSGSESDTRSKKKKKSPPKRQKSPEKNKSKAKNRSKDKSAAVSGNNSGKGKRVSQKQINGKKISPEKNKRTIADRLLDMAQYGNVHNGGVSDRSREDHEDRGAKDRHRSSDRRGEEERSEGKSNARRKDDTSRDRSRTEEESGRNKRGDMERGGKRSQDGRRTEEDFDRNKRGEMERGGKRSQDDRRTEEDFDRNKRGEVGRGGKRSQDDRRTEEDFDRNKIGEVGRGGKRSQNDRRTEEDFDRNKRGEMERGEKRSEDGRRKHDSVKVDRSIKTEENFNSKNKRREESPKIFNNKSDRKRQEEKRMKRGHSSDDENSGKNRKRNATSSSEDEDESRSTKGNKYMSKKSLADVRNTRPQREKSPLRKAPKKRESSSDDTSSDDKRKSSKKQVLSSKSGPPQAGRKRRRSQSSSSSDQTSSSGSEEDVQERRIIKKKSRVNKDKQDMRSSHKERHRTDDSRSRRGK
ncbi:unnamed protein product [Lymnaea stagnalis]|uniref:MI domain-containing protein n=1 Tax=Lymnaea stagnalis TaxID=6523 RepID=A0AAV2GWN1_LYMST